MPNFFRTLAATVTGATAPTETRGVRINETSGDLFRPSVPGGSGVVVNEDSALRYGPAFAAISLLVDAVSSLPVELVEGVGLSAVPAEPQPRWLTTPSHTTTSTELWADTMSSLLLDGNAFVAIASDPSTGEVVRAEVLDPRRVIVERDADAGVRFWITTMDGQQQYLPPFGPLVSAGVLHIRGLRRPGWVRGMSPLEAGAGALGLGLAAEAYAQSVFRNSATPVGVIEASAALTEDQAREMLEVWQATHSFARGSAGLPAILSGGASWKPLALSPETLQLQATRQLSLEDTARLFRVPPNLIGDLSHATYSNFEQSVTSFLTFSVRPWLTRIESAWATVLPEGQALRFDADAIARADMAARFAAYSTGILNGVLSPNEARGREGLAPVPGGDALFRPLNVAPLDDPTPAAPVAPTPAPADGGE